MWPRKLNNSVFSLSFVLIHLYLSTDLLDSSLCDSRVMSVGERACCRVCGLFGERVPSPWNSLESFTLLYIALSLQLFVYTPGGLANRTLFCDPGVLLLCPPRQNCNSNDATIQWTQRTQPPLSSASSLEHHEQMLQLIIIIIIIPQLATLSCPSLCTYLW